MLRLVGHVDALTGNVVLPSVIWAPQTAFLVPAEPERNPAVRAEFVHEAVASFGIPECDQAFGEKLDPDRRTVVVRQFLG